MPSDILQQVARDIQANKQRIADTRFLVELLRDAGEDTRNEETRLRDLEKKQTKWEEALRSRGMEIV